MIDVGAALDEEGDGSLVADSRGLVERRFALEVLSIQIGLAFNEQLKNES
jgi:hypothetical protein